MTYVTISEDRLKTLMKETFKEEVEETTEIHTESYWWESLYPHDKNKEISE